MADTGRLIHLCFVLAVILACGQASADWSVVNSCWRPDENPFSKTQVWDNWVWAEGWGEKEQFWPKYFKPAGSIHIILRNDSPKAASLELADLDGRPFSEVVTNPSLAGRVVWRLIFPRDAGPGQWIECILRLREKPSEDVLVGLRSGGQRFEVRVPVAPNRVRLEAISFSPGMDRLYVYVRALDGGVPEAGSVRLDLADETACRWWPGPKGSGMEFAEVALKSPWELGSYHLIQVSLADGTHLAYPVRAWDSYYLIGLFGDDDIARLKEAKGRGINTYIHPGDKAMMDSVDMNYVPHNPASRGRDRVPGRQTGNLMYYNMDEPDAHDIGCSDVLPYMDRLGLYAQREVLARFWEQYDADPRTPAMLLVNNTFKPLNYYVYGQCVDIYCSDPYVPLGGDQCEYIARALECARDASAPCPLLACLWATTEAPPPYRNAQARPPTPVEERLMAFYALGAGAKGVMYFADRGVCGVSQDRPLWDEIGRINADIAALAPYLAIGCPAGPPAENEKVWYRAIMCGRDRMVVVVVNKGHHIGYNTRQGFAWHWAAKDASVTAALPAHFGKCRVEEVRNGRFVTAQCRVEEGELRMALDEVDTARAFLVSAE